MAKHTVFYIPGLGTGLDPLRRFGLRFWRLYGLRAELIPMQWYEDQDFGQKHTKTLACIDAAIARGEIVSLVGESAGATMAIISAVERPAVNKVILISGAANPYAEVIDHIKRRSPSFMASLALLKQRKPQLKLLHTMTIRALIDGSVYPQNTVIKGAHNYRTPIIGHMVNIVVCNTLLVPFIAGFIKRP